MDRCSLIDRLKDTDPRLRIIRLAHNMRSVLKAAGSTDTIALGVDQIFIWTAEPSLLLAIVKNMEDHLNVAKDTELAMVRVLILEAENYEKAMELYHRYQPYVFGTISDTPGPRLQASRTTKQALCSLST